MTTPNDKLLGRVVERTKARPSFLGHALSLYQESRGLSDAELAAWFDCSGEQLIRLSLCRRPVGTDVTFRNDVETVAKFAGVDAGRLVQVLRAADSITALRDAPPGAAGLPPVRLAAREAGKASDAGKPEGGEDT